MVRYAFRRSRKLASYLYAIIIQCRCASSFFHLARFEEYSTISYTTKPSMERVNHGALNYDR